MKKRLISLLLAVVLVLSAAPVSYASGDGFDFMDEVNNELPEASGIFLDGDVSLPETDTDDFISEVSGELPNVRSDGFLAKPSAPLKTFPEAGGLLAEVSAPAEDATEIASADDLQKLSAGGSFVLTADIDLSGSVWTPIETAAYTSITLDGQGHTISGLTMDGYARWQGLIYSVYGLTARNLILSDVSIDVASYDDTSGAMYTGALAASVSDHLVLENCVLDNVHIFSSNGELCFSYLGGFVGSVNTSGNVTVQDCAVRGSFDLDTYEGSSAYYNDIGGMFGQLSGSSVSMIDCLSDVDISLLRYESGDTTIGGLAGGIQSGTTTFLRCVSSGDVEGVLNGYSGFAPYSSKYGCTPILSLEDCLFNGSLVAEVTEPDSYFAGFLHSLYAESLEMVNCRSEGMLKVSKGGVSGMLGYTRVPDETAIIRHCLADSALETAESIYAAMGCGGLVSSFSGSFMISDCLSSGSIVQAEVLDLRTKMGGLVGYADSKESGFIRCIHNGVVSGGVSGGLIGIADYDNCMTFTDCANYGTITSTYQTETVRPYIHSVAGGLFGIGNGTFENCVAAGTVSGEVAGGLHGETYEHYSSNDGVAEFSDCRANLTLGGKTMGGLLGSIEEDDGETFVTISNCSSALKLISNEEAEQTLGGLIGNGYGEISQCRAEYSITHTGEQKLHAAGLVGKAEEELSIWDCETDVSLANTSGGTFAGMVGIGKDLTFNNCVSRVDLVSGGKVSAGGILGSSTGEVIMTRCTATGSMEMSDCNAGGLISGVSDLVLGECCASVDLYASGNDVFMGGLVESSEHTAVYSCWADGTLSIEPEDPDAFYGGCAGGLLGRAGTLAMQDCCFLGDMRDAYDGGGGLAASATGIIRNCYVKASVSGRGRDDSALGGIAGYMSGTIKDCYVTGDVMGLDGYVGGIVGDGSGTVENCMVTGTVGGEIVGGIGGSRSGVIKNCTFNGNLTGSTSCTGDHANRYLGGYFFDAHCMGGIAGEMSGTISGCIVEKQIRNSRTYDIWEEGSQSDYIGGIAGFMEGQMTDCVSRGLSVSRKHCFNLYAGGLVGEAAEDMIFDNCRVEGNVSASSTADYYEDLISNHFICLGGLLASSTEKIQAGSCIVDGSITGVLQLPREESRGSVVIGGLGGNVNKLTPESCQFNGTLVYPASLGVCRTPPLLGSGTLVGSSAPEVVLPEREEEAYKVTVYGYTMENLQGYLLGDATVSVDGQSLGKTDALGEFAFSSELLNKTGLSTIIVSHPEYFDNSHFVYLADEGNHTIWLKKKTPGEIYFKTVQYQDSILANLLNRLDSVTLRQEDTDPKNVKIQVDWNNIDEEGREVYLVNGKGNKQYDLQDDTVNSIRFTTFFDPGEDIYIVAEGTYDGQKVETRHLLPVSIRKLNIRLPVDKGKQQVGAADESDEDSNLYFLPGLNLDMGFGSMVPFATDISILNEQLKIQFTWKQGETDTMDFWEVGSMSSGVDVFIEGTLVVPITDAMDGEWVGDLSFGINQIPELNHAETATIKTSLTDLEYPGVIKLEYPLPVPVPSYLETQIGVGGSGKLHFYGPYNKVNVAGSTSVTGYGMVGVGIGGSLGDEVEAKVGGEGELRPEITMTHDPAAGNPLSLDPVIDGAVSLKVTLKAYDLGGELKLKLGSFHWDKEKLEWYVLDNEGVELMSLEDWNGDWQAITRAYLEQGGGFFTEDLSLLQFSTESGANIRYENIAPNADIAMAVNSSGNAVLYFTADDGSSDLSGTAAQHTALFMSEQNADGSWGSPKKLSNDGTYPALPSASGDYVIWVESTDTGSLDGMLQSTVIQIAKNGEIVETYEPNAYVYDPRISASSDNTKATVTWMQDSKVTSENILGGSPVLYYAQLENDALGSVSKRTDALSARPVYNSYLSSAVYYRGTTNILYRGYGYVVSDVLNYTTDGSITVNIDEDGLLNVYDRSSLVKSIQTNFCQNGSPVLVSDPTSYGRKYIFWAENGCIRYIRSTSNSKWSDPLVLTLTDGTASQLCASVNSSGIACVSYLLRTTDASDRSSTNLCTMTVNPDNMDFVLKELSYDEAHLLNTGELKLSGLVYNNSLTDASGTKVVITDESGETVYAHTFDHSTASCSTSRFHAFFAPDGVSAHTYTVSITPVVNKAEVSDSDLSDNSLSVGLTEGFGEIVQLGFIPGSAYDAPQLQALVRNCGGTALQSMTVTIRDEAGTAVSEQRFENVPSGSTRQLLLSDIQANERYTVTVLSGDKQTDCQTLLYADPDAPFLSVSALEIEDDSALLLLDGQGQYEEACFLILALYQDGRMCYASGTTVSDLNGKEERSFTFPTAPSRGEYEYSLFFLADDGTYSPVITPKTGLVTIR